MPLKQPSNCLTLTCQRVEWTGEARLRGRYLLACRPVSRCRRSASTHKTSRSHRQPATVRTSHLTRADEVLGKDRRHRIARPDIAAPAPPTRHDRHRYAPHRQHRLHRPVADDGHADHQRDPRQGPNNSTASAPSAPATRTTAREKLAHPIPAASPLTTVGFGACSHQRHRGYTYSVRT